MAATFPGGIVNLSSLVGTAGQPMNDPSQATWAARVSEEIEAMQLAIYANELDTVLGYTGTQLTLVTYNDKTPARRVEDSLAYTGDNLSTLTRRFYAADGTTLLSTITSTMNYTGDDLTSVTKVVT